MTPTMMTENAYALCDQHAAAWRDGGNTVGMRPLADDERGEYTECADCPPSTYAVDDIFANECPGAQYRDEWSARCILEWLGY